jgi:hypothetical protein
MPPLADDPPNQPLFYQGDIKIGTQFYRATIDNKILEDVSSILTVEGANISAENSTGDGMKLACRAIEMEHFTPYRDHIAVFQTVTSMYEDGSGLFTNREQQGLFMVMPTPSTEFTEDSGVEVVEGRGPLFKLRNGRISKPYNLAAGTVITTAMRTQCDLVYANHSIPPAAATLPKKKTWSGDVTREQIFNDLARWAGYIPAFEDRFGRIRSHAFRRLGDQVPAFIFSNANANVTGKIVRTNDFSNLYNEVTVVGSDPKKRDVSIYAHRINNRPDSPTSTVVLGTKTDPMILTRAPVEDPNLHSQTACDAAADALMDKVTSSLVTMTVSTIPILEWALDSTIKCDLDTKDGNEVASGTWRVKSLNFGLGKNATYNWTLSKVFPWGEVL